MSLTQAVLSFSLNAIAGPTSRLPWIRPKCIALWLYAYTGNAKRIDQMLGKDNQAALSQIVNYSTHGLFSFVLFNAALLNQKKKLASHQAYGKVLDVLLKHQFLGNDYMSSVRGTVLYKELDVEPCQKLLRALPMSVELVNFGNEIAMHIEYHLKENGATKQKTEEVLRSFICDRKLIMSEVFIMHLSSKMLLEQLPTQNFDEIAWQGWLGRTKPLSRELLDYMDEQIGFNVFLNKMLRSSVSDTEGKIEEIAKFNHSLNFIKSLQDYAELKKTKDQNEVLQQSTPKIQVQSIQSAPISRLPKRL